MLKKICTVKLENKKLMTGISLCTMCLLIISAIVIISIITLTPIIILGLAEIEAGQRDIILMPHSGTQINITRVNQLTSLQAMPRIKTTVMIDKQGGVGWFMDLQLQAKYHLGYLGGDVNDTIGNIVYLSSRFQFQKDKMINISLEDKSLFQQISHNIPSTNPQKTKIQEQIQFIISQLRVQGQFKVQQTFDDSRGKFSQGSVSNYCYFDIHNTLTYLIQSSYKQAGHKLQNSQFLKYIKSKSFSLQDYSTQATINLPDRIKIYSNPDYQATYYYLSKFGSQILDKIGWFSVETVMPIATSLKTMGLFGMFIGVMLKLIIASLFILSVIMMNNMILVGLQRKNFDFALLKMLGAGRLFVILNIIFDSMKYVIISNLIAYPIAYQILLYSSTLFETFFGYHYPISPTFDSVIGGLFIGVLVPIVASILPIRGIIGNDLVEGLNPIRNKTQAYHTQIYIEGRQFPYGKLIFGLVSTSFGLMIYYFLPKGLIDQDPGLLLAIFFLILLGLLLGLILLAYSFQYISEKVVAFITLFWINSVDFNLMIKNLSGHRMKNRRASILYSLSVAFIVFVSVGINIQIQTIFHEILKVHGSYVQIKTPWYTDDVNKQFYDDLLKDIPGVVDWSYQTKPLAFYLSSKGVQKILVSDSARIFFFNSQIYGVSPNFLNTLYSTTCSIAQGPNTNLNPFQYLYTKEGENTVVMSQYLYNKFKLSNQEGSKSFLINFYKKSSMYRKSVNFSFVLSKRAGLKFSPFPFGNHQIAISLDQYMTFAQISDFSKIPFWKIKVQINDTNLASPIADQIRQKTSHISQLTIWDYSGMKGTIQNIDNLLSNILTILLIIVLIISLFSLITTSYINIINQTNEIGILLTLGYSKYRIVKIYTYQAFVLVFNSCLIGAAVGSFVAWMMSLQRQLFGDYPIVIKFQGIWIIAVAAVISSIISTIQPAREILRQPINSILKYT